MRKGIVRQWLDLMRTWWIGEVCETSHKPTMRKSQTGISLTLRWFQHIQEEGVRISIREEKLRLTDNKPYTLGYSQQPMEMRKSDQSDEFVRDVFDEQEEGVRKSQNLNERLVMENVATGEIYHPQEEGMRISKQTQKAGQRMHRADVAMSDGKGVRRMTTFNQSAFSIGQSEWSPEASELAQAEGWDVFDVGGARGEQPQIQRDDRVDRFDGDLSARAYVQERMMQGSPLHTLAWTLHVRGVMED